MWLLRAITMASHSLNQPGQLQGSVTLIGVAVTAQSRLPPYRNIKLHHTKKKNLRCFHIFGKTDLT